MRKQKYTILCSLILFLSGCGFVFANDGDATFNSTQIHIVNITCWQLSFWDTLMATHTLDSSMPCSVNIDGVQLDTIGIKLKGNSSFSSYPGQKKSIKLSFDEYNDTLKFDGLKTINLNNGFKDPTMLREKIFLDFLRSHGLPAPRCTYAKVYINGTYWGLYDLVEQVNKTFLNDLIGNKDGNLFKGDPQGSLQWLGSADTSYYPKYELKTNDSLNNWTDLVHFINKLNNTPSHFYDSLETVLNTGTYIQQWAANILFANLDSYQGSGHNYYIYHNTLTNKFEWIAWDVNESFGNFNMGMNVSQMENLSYDFIPNPANSRPLSQKMLAELNYKNQYVNTLCVFLQNDFKSEALFPIIDTLANRIRNDLYADTKKMYTNQQFEDNLISDISVTGPGGNTIPGLKSFITNRRTSLLTQLASFGCVMSTQERAMETNNFIFYPNPFSTEATLNFTDTSTENKVKRLILTDLLGSELLNETFTSNQAIVSGSKLESGIYFYSLFVEGQLVAVGKCIVAH